MTAIDDSLHARWVLLKPEKQVGLFVRGNAIPDFFVAHPEIGSPIEMEKDTGDGGKVQAFSGAVVVWYPDSGVSVVTS